MNVRSNICSHGTIQTYNRRKFIPNMYIIHLRQLTHISDKRQEYKTKNSFITKHYILVMFLMTNRIFVFLLFFKSNTINQSFEKKIVYVVKIRQK